MPDKRTPISREISITSPFMTSDDSGDIKRINQALKNKGYDVVVSNTFYPRNGEALRAWKYDAGFPMGAINKRLMPFEAQWLFDYEPLTPQMAKRAAERAPKPSKSNTSTKGSYAQILFRIGDSGDRVKEIQRHLNAAIDFGLTVDGQYGPMTAAAVEVWEYEIGVLHPDGMVSRGEWPILVGKKEPTPAYKKRAAARKAMPQQTNLGARAVDFLERYVGVTESPAGSNRVPELARLAKAQGLSHWYQKGGWPWCMFFVFLGLNAVGSKAAADGFAGKWNVLYTVDLLQRAKAKQFGFRFVSESQARKGDLVLINFPGGEIVDHVGILRAAPSRGRMKTLEGNTSAGNSGSQSNGGGVFRRERPTAGCTFIRVSR